jgi:hypothetical protein
MRLNSNPSTTKNKIKITKPRKRLGGMSLSALGSNLPVPPKKEKSSY